MENNGILRSPLFYVGDKYKLMKEIKTHFPENINRFIEPFVGGGSVFMNVKAQHYFLNDIEESVIQLHQILCQYAEQEDNFFNEMYHIIDEYGLSCSFRNDIVPESLKREYPKTFYAKFNKENFVRLRHNFNHDDRGNLIKLYVLLIYGFNRTIRFNSAGEYNLPVGNVDFNKNTSNALKSYFKYVQGKDLNWSNLDFAAFLNGLEIDNNDLIYLDPPYLITFSEYNKLWNEETEQRLLVLLDELNQRHCRFAISNVTHYKGKVNELFLQWSQNYNVHTIKSNYISFRDNTNKTFNEVLVTNY